MLKKRTLHKILAVLTAGSFFLSSTLSLNFLIFAQESSQSAVIDQQQTPTPATSPTETPTTQPVLSPTQTPETTIPPTPTILPTISPLPQTATDSSFLKNKEVKHSLKGEMDLYFERDDWQAKENPNFIITFPTTASSSANLFPNFIPFLIKPVFAQDSQIATISAKILNKDRKEISVPTKITQVGQNIFGIDLEKGNAFEPGKFTLVVQNGSDSVSQDFNWGVLAINIDKSIYLPNEKADIQMAVLDETGKMVCDASLELKIQAKNSGSNDVLSTENGKITINPECQTHEVTQKPDYEASYQVSGPDIYKMTLTAKTKNGIHTISDSFEVKNEVSFDIARDGPTRIYPPNSYPVTLKITANQDFDGTVIETVPASFDISPGLHNRSYDSVETQKDIKILKWQVSIKKGDQFNLGYNFNTPAVSPQFYLIGPLQIGDFKEIRQWQIAADVAFPATSYLSNTASAVITGTTSWQLITTAPAVGDSTTSCKNAKTTGYCQETPGAANTLSGQTVPTVPNGKGWIYDTALNSTIPTGTWTFNVRTNSSSATGTGFMTVCAWKVKISAGAISTYTNFINCVDGTTNLQSVTTALNSSVSVTGVAAQSYAANEYLYVEYWLHTTVAGTSTTGKVTFVANNGSAESIVTPGVSSNLAPSAPTQNSPANAATGISTTPTFTMTTTDPESNNLSYKVTIYSNSGCTTVVQTNDQAVSSTGWTGTNATCTASPTSCYTSGTQGSYATQTALSSSTQYWWKVSAKDPDGNGSFTDSSTCNTFTTASANLAPNSPTTLIQKKVTGGATLATGDWTNETQVQFTASASDPNNPDTLQLCVEKKPLGTAFANTEDACGTGVAYSGTAVTVSLTITGLTDATEYHWQARIKDAAAAYSAWVSYPDPTPNLESARDFGVDTTAPTGGIVYDGTTTGVDAQFNNGSLSALSANWSGFNANASGLLRYDYAIGTTAGGTDVVTWTSNGVTTSVTVSTLTLQTSKIYYISVRAVDNAGNIQTGVSSDGQAVAPTLTFSFTPTSVAFANLNSANSYTNTQNTTVTTSTNAYNGYVIRIFTTQNLTSTIYPSTTIGGFTGGTYATPAVYGGGDTGFGVTSSDSLVQGVNKFAPSGGVGTLYFAPSHTGAGDIIADNPGLITGTPITNEAFTITYKVVTSQIQAASPYSTTAVYTTTPQY